MHSSAHLVAEVFHRRIPAAIVTTEHGRLPEMCRDIVMIVTFDSADRSVRNVLVVGATVTQFYFTRKPTMTGRNHIGALCGERSVTVVRVVVGYFCND